MLSTGSGECASLDVSRQVGCYMHHQSGDLSFLGFN